MTQPYNLGHGWIAEYDGDRLCWWFWREKGESRENGRIAQSIAQARKIAHRIDEGLGLRGLRA